MFWGFFTASEPGSLVSVEGTMKSNSTLRFRGTEFCLPLDQLFPNEDGIFSTISIRATLYAPKEI
jgi:hypothetical protein